MKVMANFQIMEDSASKPGPEKIKFHEKARKRIVSNRIALQSVINKPSRDIKRAKLCSVSAKCENVPPIHISTVVEIDKKVVVEEIPNFKLSQPNIECSQIINHENNKKIIQNPKVERIYLDDLPYHEEYLKDIRSYLTLMESTVKWPKANYIRKQTNLTSEMRCVLIDWLVAVAEEYNLSDQTIHLSVNYIDRFLSQMSVVRDKFQLLGSAAMMLAGKVEDIYPPDSKEWAYLSGSTYTGRQVQRMEQLLLKVLKFDLQPPTILVFIQQLCVEHNLDKTTMNLAMYFSELVLLEGDDYLHYLPSKLAAASVALARMTLSKRFPWPKKLATTSGYSLKQLSPVVKRQNITFTDSPTKPHQAIQVKYQADKYHKVAFLKPKVLNLDSSDDE